MLVNTFSQWRTPTPRVRYEIRETMRWCRRERNLKYWKSTILRRRGFKNSNIEIGYSPGEPLYSYSVNRNRSRTRVDRNETIGFVIRLSSSIFPLLWAECLRRFYAFSRTLSPILRVLRIVRLCPLSRQIHIAHGVWG